MFLLGSLVLVATLFVCNVAGQCNSTVSIGAGETYILNNPNYPWNYSTNTVCLYKYIAPSLSQLNLYCYDFHIPYSNGCAEGRFLVSWTGDTTFSDADQFCGSGTFNETSESNIMTMALIVPNYSKTGYFSCTITATEQPTPPPSCDCGWTTRARIVNGKETGIHEFPMMAGLMDLTKQDPVDQMFCGGTIISARYCLTAAHCLVNKQTQNVLVYVGIHNINEISNTNGAQRLTPEQFIAHPRYSTLTQQNDIALIRTIENIIFNDMVGPACLPFRYPRPAVNSDVEVLGWGTMEQAGPKSDVLMKTDLNVINSTVCQNTYGSKFTTTSQMCTYKSGTDACQADSGGPVLQVGDFKKRLHLSGVISYGRGCAENIQESTHSCMLT